MNPDVLLTIIKVAAAFIGLSFIIFWVGLVWWVSQDVLTRTEDKIIISAAVAITAILGPVGILIYLIVRPKQTIKERIGEMTDREMLLYASSVALCPACTRIVQAEAKVCPYCGVTLKKNCRSCQQPLAMDWEYCPACGSAQQNGQSAPVTVEVAEVPVATASDQVVVIEEPQAPTNWRLNRQAVSDVLRGLFMPVQNQPFTNQNDSIIEADAKTEAPPPLPSRPRRTAKTTRKTTSRTRSKKS